MTVMTPPLLSLLIPALSLLFAGGFFALWRARPAQTHFFLFGAAYLAFSSALACQILNLPPDGGANILLAGMLYAAGALLLIEGCFRRIGRRPDRTVTLLLAIGIVGGLAWFYYGDPRIVARLYIQNFGYGLILVIGAMQLGEKGRGKPIDRAIFWILLVFGLHFFPRTLLSAAPEALGGDAGSFTASAFEASLVFSLTLFSTGLAMTLLAAAAIDRIEDIRRQGDTDSLTGILNRRAFERAAANLLAETSDQPPCLVTCDIDEFKRINDTWGHQAGDHVIRTFAALLAANVRDGDSVGRTGGEEFGLILNNCSRANAHRLAERIRGAFARTPFLFDGEHVHVTASFGVASQQPGETFLSLSARADALLYAAKSKGRNRTASDRPADNVVYVDPRAWSGGRG
ncbi:MAG TPA: GGDEF domain-containing protein [Sphingomonadaceae bacterium]|nr:GGDEF domain-containing protein [Sphingomonadaceae bacterium]